MMKKKCAMTIHRYGNITGRYVIYRGENTEMDSIQYLNVEDYLKVWRKQGKGRDLVESRLFFFVSNWEYLIPFYILIWFFWMRRVPYFNFFFTFFGFGGVFCLQI